MVEKVLRAYQDLAYAYDDAGFANYTTYITPEIIEALQADQWLGRRIADLGCGTGASAAFLGSIGMEVWAYDISPAMLKIAAMRVDDMQGVRLEQADIREVNLPNEMDLVLAIGGVLNEQTSLRDIALILKKSYDALQPERRMVFDLWTPRGLGKYLNTGQQLLDVSNTVFIGVNSQFNFDRMALKQAFTIFTQKGDEHWSRADAFLTLYAYPWSSIEQIIEKIGFSVRKILTSELTPYNAEQDREGRMLVICEKPA